MKRKNVEHIADWPPYSCDLNMIEPLWHLLQQRVGEKHPFDLESLKRAALEAWEELDQKTIDKYVLGFSAKLEAVTLQKL